jgi:alpha-N-arabinofuranosidase
VVLTDKERMVLTPTYHAFAMHLPFMDATSLPVQLSGVPTYTLGKYSIPAVSASAAKGADGKLLLSLANTNPNQPLQVQLAVGGQGVRAATGQLLTAAAMDAENRFDAPDRVKPQPFKAQARDGQLALTLPAKSVLVLELQP